MKNLLICSLVHRGSEKNKSQITMQQGKLRVSDNVKIYRCRTVEGLLNSVMKTKMIFTKKLTMQIYNSNAMWIITRDPWPNR